MDPQFRDVNNCTVAVIGLGYVGMPLALEIANGNNKKFHHTYTTRYVVGFDIDDNRIK